MGLQKGITQADAQPGVCTSTTRPSSPFIGQTIFETDTNRLRVYTASGWSIGTQFTNNTVPSAPQNLTATAGNGQVSLSWSAPASNGGSAVTDYRIYYNTGGAFTLVNDGVSTATNTIVTGLTNLTTYAFSVSAVNAVGEGTSISTSSTPMPPTVTSLEYLIVAGGGGGAHWAGGGGGGAGGFRTGTASGIVAGTVYTITVGGGGSGGASTTSGIDSSAFSITSTGGGKGGDSDYGAPSSGGSGGGGGRTNQSGAAGIAGQGNNGGSASNMNAGGGGGASQVGANGTGASGGTGGKGGDGSSSSITGTATTYAGGGGGGAHESGATGGAGGAGGGGAANSGCSNASPGTPNTGGGGGGSSGVTMNCGVTSAAGGSGIVILAYNSALPAAVATTGSPTVSTVSRPGWRVYTFTGSGSITF